MPVKNFYAISYDELDTLVEKLYSKIKKDSFVPDLMLAIARGGFLATRILSDLFESDNCAVDVFSITIKHYLSIGKQNAKPVMLQELSHNIFGLSILVVDDVSDTGDTLLFVKDYLTWLGAKDIRIATVFIKSQTKFVPDYYEKEISQDTWIVFPYERREIRYQQEQLKNNT